MKKTSLLLLVLVLIISALSGCEKPEPIESPIVSDQVTQAIADQPTAEPLDEVYRIVSTVPSVTEILFLLGSGDEIVGVDLYSNYPEEALDIEKVGDYSGFDIEKVISLEPDFVFAGNKLQREEIDALADLGINVIETEPNGLNDITSSITEIGEVLGKQAEAKEITDNINSVIEATEQKTLLSSYRPTVYYVMGIGEYGNWTSGEGSFINDAMELAGGICVTAGSPVPWMDYPLEDLILADPDILIVSGYITEADLLADATYAELTAVKEGNYFFINPDLIERPGPRITEALEYLQANILGE
ncbi:MAG: ABC transporter substrate-binding protein [Clostridia bacterium]|nr:ABC transporter substrate-binding protein [Clostridia bacterium]